MPGRGWGSTKKDNIPEYKKKLVKKETTMTLEEAKKDNLDSAIAALKSACPRTVYIICGDGVSPCLTKMYVDKVEVDLHTGAVLLTNQNIGKPGTPECSRYLSSVILDEDEAVKQWKKKGEE